ncbi:hypothetical protein ACMHYB_45895 [Sorangium sp. So ce1128]
MWLVSELWSVEDLVRTALAEPAAPPVPQALTPPAQTGSVRQLPGGKGWLRLVSGGSAQPAPAAPQPPPIPPVTVPAPEPEPPRVPAPASSQGRMVQLSLFGDPPSDTE